MLIDENWLSMPKLLLSNAATLVNESAAVTKTESFGCGAPVGDQLAPLDQMPVPAPRIQTRLTAEAAGGHTKATATTARRQNQNRLLIVALLSFDRRLRRFTGVA